MEKMHRQQKPHMQLAMVARLMLLRKAVSNLVYCLLLHHKHFQLADLLEVLSCDKCAVMKLIAPASSIADYGKYEQKQYEKPPHCAPHCLVVLLDEPNELVVLLDYLLV